MNRYYWTCVIAFCVVLMMVAWPLSAQAMPLALPPRPSPQPTVIPAAGSSGGFVELHLQGTGVSPTLWTTVQWQNPRGDWQTVEGWQGTPWERGRVVWWVQHGDLGKGPFRWMVYSAPGGKLLATSQPFHLPGYDGATEQVILQLAD